VIVALVFVGGAIGAPSRYLLDRFVQSRHGWRFPLGTLTVNGIGCFVLGMLAGSDLSTRQYALIGTGFCGGLTTFSTFSVEAIELLRGRRGVAAAGYVLLSCALGVGVAALGYSLG
jgi:CrcB protein